jgi:hypothetical protein
MASAAEYRHYANECIEWARKAETDEDRATFLRMAVGWRRAADILSKRAKVRVPASALLTAAHLRLRNRGR